jgi:peptide/nickel transport system permease protein
MAGYFGGAMDDVIMRIAEIQMAFPLLVLALILMAVFGPGAKSMFVAFTISGWPIFAKIARGIVLSIRDQEFIEAARAIGCGNSRLIIRHISPNVLPYIFVLATLQFSGMVLTEAGLSFVGIGIQPPTPSWGNMLGEGRVYLSNAWWLATIPGIALIMTVLGANLLSDGLQIVLDPRARERTR